jgi:hypothetical protein
MMALTARIYATRHLSDERLAKLHAMERIAGRPYTVNEIRAKSKDPIPNAGDIPSFKLEKVEAFVNQNYYEIMADYQEANEDVSPGELSLHLAHEIDRAARRSTLDFGGFEHKTGGDNLYKRVQKAANAEQPPF